MSDAASTIRSLCELTTKIDLFYGRLWSCAGDPRIWARAPDLPTDLALIRDHLSLSVRLMEKLDLESLIEKLELESLSESEQTNNDPVPGKIDFEKASLPRNFWPAGRGDSDE